MRSAATVLAALLALAGCRLDVDWSGTRYACDPGDRCPPGFDCVAGWCEAGEDPDGGAIVDAPASPDAPGEPAPRCGGARLLWDDFSAAERGPDWGWSQEVGGATLSQAGGAAVVDLPSGVTARAYYQSHRTYDLRDDELSIRVLQVAGGAAETFLRAHGVDNRRADLGVRQGNLELKYRAGPGPLQTIAIVPYDATAHAHWRIREGEGTVFWETSPDGATWQTHAEREAGAFVGAVRLTFGADSLGALAAPTQARFDDLNGGAPKGGGWCGASSFQDDFEGEDDDHRWSLSFQSCTRERIGGRARFTLREDGSAYCAYMTAPMHDLRGDQVVVEVPAIGLATATGVQAYLRLQRDEPDRGGIRMMLENGGLYFQFEVDGEVTTVGDVPWDAAAHRWWRIRGTEQGGQPAVVWETAPDGIAWVERAVRVAPGVRLDALHVLVGAGTYLAVPDAGWVEFDHYNLPPE
jgi:hypothetical protein